MKSTIILQAKISNANHNKQIRWIERLEGKYYLYDPPRGRQRIAKLNQEKHLEHIPSRTDCQIRELHAIVCARLKYCWVYTCFRTLYIQVINNRVYREVMVVRVYVKTYNHDLF